MPLKHDEYTVVWNGGPLTDGASQELYEMQNRVTRTPGGYGLVIDEQGGWGYGFSVRVLRIDPRQSLRKRRSLRSGIAQRVVNRRFKIGHRPQRTLIGERAPGAKLQDQDVLEIRRLYSAGNGTHKSLAALFGVSAATVSMIVNGDTWRHLPLIPPAADAVDPHASSTGKPSTRE